MATPKRRSFLDLRPKIESSSIDFVLLIVVGLLVVLGLAFFASSISTQPQEVYYSELIKQGVAIILGITAAVIIYKIDYRFLLKNSGRLMILNFVLLGFLATFVLFIKLSTWGQGVVAVNNFSISLINQFRFLPFPPHFANGAISWINFRVLNFQPSELSKLVVLLYFCFYISKTEIKDTWEKLKKPLYGLVLTIFLIIIQPDLGTATLLMAIIFSSLWVSDINKKFITLLILMGVIFFSIATLTAGYRVQRFLAVFDSEAVNSASGDQVRGVQRAIANGGLWGKGYGQSEFKRQSGVLLEESTDTIIAVIGEEIGFIMTSIFLFLYLLFLFRGLKIAKEAPDLGGKTLATGITVWIVLHAFLNIAGATGIVPLSGFPLPFISKGGSAMLMNLLIVGVLLNISQQKKDEKNSKKRGKTAIVRKYT
jgi:cell division protein FtsW (lipid II flippase)